MLLFCERMNIIQHAPNVADLKSQISDLKSLSESCSRQLRAWADSLQNSTIKGQRHLTNATRSAYDKRQRADAFMAKLDLIRNGADPHEVFGDLSDNEQS